MKRKATDYTWVSSTRDAAIFLISAGEETSVSYAVNEAVSRSFATKGVGATGQTSQMLKRAGVMAPGSYSSPSDTAGRTRGAIIRPLDPPHPASYTSILVALSGKAGRLVTADRVSAKQAPGRLQ